LSHYLDRVATTEVLYIQLWRDIGAGWQTDPESVGGWGIAEIAGPISGLAGGWRHWVECANLLGNSGWDLWRQEEDGTPGCPSSVCTLIFKRRSGRR
jgi:hypothetical protein